MYFSIFLLLAPFALGRQFCRLTPSDPEWPSVSEWAALNTSIGGALLETRPIASSCYSGNPFDSPDSCEFVEDNWANSSFHSSLPESVDAPFYANNSCLAPNDSGFRADQGCQIGCLPKYVVNATTEQQIGTAMEWASERNIRIIIKGTGHDINGRSSGAYSLSIWTHHFTKIAFDATWKVPGSNDTGNVIITGSGNAYGPLFEAAFTKGRALITGNDATVGVGGHIQGGGYGPLTSRLGLPADQLLEARVVTTRGKVLVANALHNQDLFNAVTADLLVSAATNDPAATNATWFALAELAASFPDLVDKGIGGGGLANSSAGSPVTFSFALEAFNMTVEKFNSIIGPVRSRIDAYGDSKGIISVQMSETVSTNFLEYFKTANISPQPAGGGHILSSRLLGRPHLSGLPRSKLVSLLRKISRAQHGGICTAILTTPGGPGPRMVEEKMRGALNPTWRSAYAHIMSTGGTFDTTLPPQSALDSTNKWVEENLEIVFREWAPDARSYMNEANPFAADFKEQFYGENYARLLEIKHKYDPTDSLFEIGGVGSDSWRYDLNTGKLCCAERDCRGHIKTPLHGSL